MEYVVVKQIFAISIIILSEKAEIGLLVDTPAEIQDGIEIEVPSLALHESEGPAEFLVEGGDLETRLPDAGIFQDVAVVLTVDDGYPEFGMYQHPVGDHG